MRPLPAQTSDSLPLVADFNGDGIKDIAVVEAADCQGSGPYTLNVLLGNPDGSFQPEQVVYTSNDAFMARQVVQLNGDTKPDIYAMTQGPAPGYAQTQLLFTNVSDGAAFPGCDPPIDPWDLVFAARPAAFLHQARFISASVQPTRRLVAKWKYGSTAGR